MNYRKKQITDQLNQLLEYRYFNKKYLNEDVKFTMQPDGELKKILKMVDGKPEPLSDEEKNEIKDTKFKKEESVLKAIEKLNQKFGQM
jgi:hypothetical protein